MATDEEATDVVKVESSTLQQLMEIEEIDLVSNFEEFDCPVCSDHVPIGEGVILRDCLHTFCRECLRKAIDQSTGAEVKCLFKNLIYSCDSCLQQREVRSLVSPDLYERYIEQSIREAERISQVQTQERDVEATDVVKMEPSIGQQLLDMNEIDLVPNFEEFECPVCFDDIPIGEGVILRECLHTFCKECLREAIEQATGAEVKCLFKDLIYACDSCLQQREVRSLASAELYERYIGRSIREAERTSEGSFHCKTPDCPGWCEFDEDVTEFLCPVCGHQNCLKCKVIHQNLTCQQYKDQITLVVKEDEDSKKTKEYVDSLLNAGTVMHCPKCGVDCTKEEGCDWAMCTICKVEICWATKGPRWGPNGNGDTSAGCKCKIGGVKCHPMCQNCH